MFCTGSRSTVSLSGGKLSNRLLAVRWSSSCTALQEMAEQAQLRASNWRVMGLMAVCVAALPLGAPLTMLHFHFSSCKELFGSNDWPHAPLTLV